MSKVTTTTKEIVELNTDDNYRLKDKDGWIAHNGCNSNLFTPELITGFKLGYTGDGYYNESAVIAKDERKFFEVVVQEEEETPPPSDNHLDVVKGTLWDGKSSLEVGMVVKCYLKLCKITILEENLDQAVLRVLEDSTLHVTSIINLSAAAKSKKEATLDKVLTAWQGKHLDYAYDTKSSVVPFGEVFDLIYDVMEGE